MQIFVSDVNYFFALEIGPCNFWMIYDCKLYDTGLVHFWRLRYPTCGKNTGKSWTSVLFKTRFDQDLFWFWKTFISFTAKLWKIFEPNLVSWLFTSQGIGLMKKCTQNWLKLSLMIRVNGHITLSCTWKYSLNERKLKQNTHLKQDLCSGFSR